MATTMVVAGTKTVGEENEGARRDEVAQVAAMMTRETTMKTTTSGMHPTTTGAMIAVIGVDAAMRSPTECA